MAETFEEKMARIKECGRKMIEKLEYDEKVARKIREIAIKELELEK